MIKVFEDILQRINPKQLFLIDGSGALVSAIMLGVVLTSYESAFGMPGQVLHILAAIASVLSAYSLICSLGMMVNWRTYLRAIAIANLLYCCLTVGLVVYFFHELSILDMLYFAGEIILITMLGIIELKTASDKQRPKG